RGWRGIGAWCLPGGLPAAGTRQHTAARAGRRTVAGAAALVVDLDRGRPDRPTAGIGAAGGRGERFAAGRVRRGAGGALPAAHGSAGGRAGAAGPGHGHAEPAAAGRLHRAARRRDQLVTSEGRTRIISVRRSRDEEVSIYES